MTSQDLRARLGELGLDESSAKVLALLPLVLVAWADGRVQPAERELITRVAKDKGWLDGKGKDLIEEWLKAPPTPEDAQRGLALLRSLAADGAAGVAKRSAISAETLKSVLLLSRDLALSAGGFFGLTGAIDESESEALQRITDALLAPGDTWQKATADAEKDSARSAPGEAGLPIVGVLPDLRRDPLGTLLKAFREHGDVCRLQFGLIEAFLLVHPDAVRHVLVTQQPNYGKGKLFESFRETTGNGLLSSEGELWRKQRRIMQPAFHRERVEGFVDIMVAKTNDLLEAWRGNDGQPIRLLDEMMRVTGSVAGLALFSRDTEEEAKEFGEAMRVRTEWTFARMRSLVPVPRSVPTAANRRINAAMDVMDRMVYGVIRERKQNGAPGRDLLAMLLEAKDEETGEGMSEKQVRDEILTLYVAGHSTSANTLTFALGLLSRHPTAAAEMVEEVDRVLGDGPFTAAMHDKLPAVTRVLEETMRLYPIAWMIPRQALVDDEIGGFKIPKGSIIFVSPYVVHRNPAFWPNPEGFDPGRFREQAKLGRPTTAYIPFGAGQRKCVGFAFAMLEMQVILAMIARRFRVDLLPGGTLDPETQTQLMPPDGLPVTIHAR